MWASICIEKEKGRPRAESQLIARQWCSQWTPKFQEHQHPPRSLCDHDGQDSKRATLESCSEYRTSSKLKDGQIPTSPSYFERDCYLFMSTT